MLRVPKLLIGLAALLSLAGCASAPIDASRPPADWPELQVSVQHTSRDLSEVCGLRGAVYWIGCAVADFDAGTCTVYLRHDSRAVLEHELLHCRGHDHAGERILADAWERYKSRTRTAARSAEPG